MPPELIAPDGTPLRRRELTREVAAPTVTGIRRVQAGHPSSGLTPPRLAAILRAAEDGDHMGLAELGMDMEEKDTHLASVLATRRLQVAQLEITVEGGDDNAADLVQDWIDRDELQDELIDILAAIGHGWSVTEILWDTSEGQWQPAGLEWRDPRWFRVDRHDGKTIRLIGEGGRDEDLPPCKFIVYVPKVKPGLPIRSGLMRAACWPYMFKNFTTKDWQIFLEVYGQPLRIGKYHAGANPEERATLLRAVAAIGTDAAAIIPEGMVIDFIESGTTSTDAYERNARWWDQQTSKLVLGQTTTTEAISGGHAVSREHNEVREDIERADARQLSATLSRQVVRPLVAFNLGPTVKPPRLRLGRPEEKDVDRMVRGVQVLVPMGLRVSQRQMRESLGLDEPDDGEELLAPGGGRDPQADPAEEPGDQPPGMDGGRSPPTRGQAPPATAGAGDRAAQARDTLIDVIREAQAREDPDALEQLAADALDDWEALIEPVLGPIDDLVDDATGLEAVRDRLAQAIAAMDPAVFAARLARAGFVASVAGRLGVEPDAGDR